MYFIVSESAFPSMGAARSWPPPASCWG